MYQAAPERRIRIAGWTILPQSDPENTSAWTKRTLVFLTLAGPCAPARVARRSVAFASTLRRDVTEWEQAVDVRICKDAIPKTNMDCPGTDSPPPYTHTVQPPNPNPSESRKSVAAESAASPSEIRPPSRPKRVSHTDNYMQTARKCGETCEAERRVSETCRAPQWRLPSCSRW